MIGLGFWEFLIILILGVVFLAIPVGVIFLIIKLTQNQPNDRVARLEEENLRLRRLLADHGITDNANPPRK
jgi:hypothetical protein